MGALDQSDPAQKPFSTTREVAKVLGVSLRTVQLWAEAGLLEAWRTEGGHRRIFAKFCRAPAHRSLVVVTGVDTADVEAHGSISEGIPVLRKPIPFDWLHDIAAALAARKRHRLPLTET
jgi:excisionase family DNA binding protein